MGPMSSCFIFLNMVFSCVGILLIIILKTWMVVIKSTSLQYGVYIVLVNYNIVDIYSVLITAMIE